MWVFLGQHIQFETFSCHYKYITDAVSVRNGFKNDLKYLQTQMLPPSNNIAASSCVDSRLDLNKPIRLEPDLVSA